MLKTKIKKTTLEPKMFALLVKSPAGTILHLGSHFTLEEAYSIASKKIKTLETYKEGDAIDIDLWNSISAKEAILMLMDPVETTVETDNLMESFDGSVKELSQEDLEDLPPVLQELLKRAVPISALSLSNKLVEKNKKDSDESNTKPVMKDYVKHVKDAKNDLMKKLIEDGNIEDVNKVKSLLGKTSIKYVMEEINKNKK